MASNIHAIIHYLNAFLAQPLALFVAAGAAGRQAQAPTGGNYPVPGQAATVWQLAQGAPDPPRGAAEASEGGELAVGHHLPCGNGRKHGVERLAALGRIVAWSGHKRFRELIGHSQVCPCSATTETNSNYS
jgi:hypothetical protein